MSDDPPDQQTRTRANARGAPDEAMLRARTAVPPGQNAGNAPPPQDQPQNQIQNQAPPPQQPSTPPPNTPPASNAPNPGANTTAPGNRPTRQAPPRAQFGAMRGGTVPGQAPNQGQPNQNQPNQAQTGANPPPNAPPNQGVNTTAPGNRPVRQGPARPQFGAMRGNAVPGIAPGPNNPPPNNPPPNQPPQQVLPPLPQVPPQPQQPPLQQPPAQQPPAQPPAQANPPPPVTPRPVVPQNEQLAPNRSGQLSARQMDRLPPNQRQWSDNVLKALKLKSKGSQARVLAGALATTSQIEQATPADAAEAKRLLQLVLAAGDPPWKDATAAMAAADAAMHLDLLSIPPAQRQLHPLGGDGVNTAFTIDRLDADGQSRPAFLCKSATERKMGWQIADKVSGIPDGGEVLREAMSARAAQTFAAQTGIDIAMPESHVVQLPAALLPPPQPPAQPYPAQVTCSIQEWGPGLTKLKELPAPARSAVRPEDVAALAVFDLMTLNTDRHGGNIMCDAQGRMLPIDHGCSFPQGDDGIGRITETMSGPHNALLRMPEAFEPMPAAMVKSLKSLKSTDYRAALEKDRDEIVAVHPTMDRQAFNGTPHPDEGQPQGEDTLRMVSNQALDWAGKAARFAKLAARNQPPLSPGAMQMAFGANAQALLAAPDFDAAAKAVIAKAAPHNETVKAVCTSDDAEYAELCRQVAALGWRPQLRGGAPLQNAISDPVVMVSIIETGIRRGNNTAQALAQVDAQTPAPNVMKARLLTMRKDMIQKFIALMPAAAQQAQVTALNALAGPPDRQMRDSDPLKIACRDAALAEQAQVMQAKIASGVSGTTKSADAARDAEAARDPIQMRIEIDGMR